MMMVNSGPSQRAQHDACVAILSRPSTIQLVTRIVEDVYVNSQLEIARAKGITKLTNLLPYSLYLIEHNLSIDPSHQNILCTNSIQYHH